MTPADAPDAPLRPDPLGQGVRATHDLAFWTFVTIAAVLLPTMVLASFDFGVTWDEKFRHEYGELIWEFFSGARSRSSFGETGDHLYGGLFDVICVGLERWLPANRYVLRHVVNASFGWVGIVYCGRLAARLFGTWTGSLAMVLLAVSPRFFADAMNNPKDAPFAALTVVASYYISTASPRWPYLSRSTAIKIVIALALAMNIRVGALLYFGYLGLLVFTFIVAERRFGWRRLLDTAARLSVMLAAVLVLGTLCWPWAQASPFIRPFRALLEVSNFPWEGFVLFNGELYTGSEPWYYAPWWLLISTPPVVLVGMLLSIAVRARGETALPKLALWTAGLLPFVLIVAMGSTQYDGIRHLEFTYPIFVMLAAAGWTAAIADRHRVWLRRCSVAVLGVGLASILIFDVRSHPNQSVYFNGLVGGPRGAFMRYDMDYWGNCVLQAVAWSAQQARSSGTIFTVSGNPEHVIGLDAERFKDLAFAPENLRRHHFKIQLVRGPAGWVRDYAEQPALYRVKTPDGVVLCTVIEGPALAEMRTR